MDPELWHDLLAEARSGAMLRRSPVHGERHWRSVAAIGLGLRQHCPAIDPQIMLAFGMLHDCRREDEHSDPDHGPRAADALADSKALAALLDARQREIVLRACRIHTSSPSLGGDADRSCAACLDADRFTLRRVGTEPERRYFSLDYDDAAFGAWVGEGDRLTDDPPAWDKLIASLAAGT